MSLFDMRIQNFRAFLDTDYIRLESLNAIVGKNDTGKSVILHALNLFFNPPLRGGVKIEDIHMKDPVKEVIVEVSLDPQKLASTEVKIDAKNKIDIVEDFLVDEKKLLRLRITYDTSSKKNFEICIFDLESTDCFPLGLKNHDELLQLLESRGLEAVKAGKETNQEKRKTIRDHDSANGITFTQRWVSAIDFEAKIRSILPTFVFFEDFARFGLEETKVQNQFKGIAGKVVSDQQMAHNIEETIEKEIQNEFDKVFERLSKLTDTIHSIKANAIINWKKSIEKINLTWSDSFGVDIPYEYRGAGTRQLFMVAYFQYEAAESLHNPDGTKYIFAIEEPEIHLHPGAQRLLIEALKELGELGHTVIFTTHSPVFVATSPKDSLILVKRDSSNTIIHQFPELEISEVAKELGLYVSDRLIGIDNVILVEGKKDEEFWNVVLEKLYNDNKTDLNPEKILFFQVGGVKNVKYTAIEGTVHKAGLKWGLIVDSDRKEESDPNANQDVLDNCADSCRFKKALNLSSIENYLDESIIKIKLGIDCHMPKYGKAKISIGGNNIASRHWNLIKNNSANIAVEMDSDYFIERSRNNSNQSEILQMFVDIKASFDI